MWQQTLSFHTPQAALLLVLLLPWLWGRWRLKLHRQQLLQLYSTHLPSLLIARSSLLERTKMAGWLLIWAFLCLSLMDPFGNVRQPAAPVIASTSNKPMPHEIIFLIDVSASMRVPDGPEGETRLEEAKDIVADIVRQFPGQMVSLYAFTSELTPLVPPTLDTLFLQLALKDLRIDQGDVGGTRLALVLQALKRQLLAQPLDKRYSIILLSDGEDTEVEMANNLTERQNAEEAILEALSGQESLQLQLFTIGMGSTKGQNIPHVSYRGQPVFSKLNPKILQQLAMQNNGLYYTALDWTSWDLAQELAAHIDKQTASSLRATSQAQQEANGPNWQSDLYYQIPLGLALIFYLFNLLLPSARRL